MIYFLPSELEEVEKLIGLGSLTVQVDLFGVRLLASIIPTPGKPSQTLYICTMFSLSHVYRTRSSKELNGSFCTPEAVKPVTVFFFFFPLRQLSF